MVWIHIFQNVQNAKLTTIQLFELCVFRCFSAQESGGSPCPSSCPDLNKSQTLSSLSESGAVLVEVCCLLVLAVDNKVQDYSAAVFTTCMFRAAKYKSAVYLFISVRSLR